MTKIISWLRANLASVLGIAQAAVKVVKELLTAVANILYPIIPSDKFKGIVEKIRGFVNKVDEILERIKKSVLGNIS